MAERLSGRSKQPRNVRACCTVLGFGHNCYDRIGIDMDSRNTVSRRCGVGLLGLTSCRAEVTENMAFLHTYETARRSGMLKPRPGSSLYWPAI